MRSIKKSKGTIFFIVGVLIILTSVIPYLNSYKFQNADVNLNFDADNAYDIIEDQLKIGNRIPGTLERQRTADYIISKFKSINNNFTFISQNFTLDGILCQNLLFKFNEGKDNIVILGTHYDSRAKATKQDSNDPVPGANDGASGTAVLIELAKVLYKQRKDLDVEIWFVFFDAEDQGKDEGGYGIDEWDWAEGSQKFVEEIDNFYDSDKEDFDCMILLDMVGGKNIEFINELYSTASLLDELFQVGRQLINTEGFLLFPKSEKVYDDHVAFLDEDVPSANLIGDFSSNSNWKHHHTTKDDLDHISKRSLHIAGQTIEQFIYNNYLEDSNENYIGNYPWKEDNQSNLQFILLIILIVGIAISGICVFLYLRNRKSGKTSSF